MSVADDKKQREAGIELDDHDFSEELDSEILPLRRAAKPAREEAAKPKHTASLKKMAQELGLDDAEIDSLSPLALGNTVHILNKRLRDEHEAYRRQTSVQTAVDRREKPAAPAVEEDDWGLDEDGKPLKEDKFSPAVVKAVKRAKDAEARLKAIEERLEKQDTAAKAEGEARKRVGLIDGAFAALGAKYEKLFGAGGITGLKAGSTEAKRRHAVCVAGGVNFADVDEKTVKQLIREGVAALYGKVSAPVEEEEGEVEIEDEEVAVDKRKRQWREGVLHRPTERAQPKQAKGPVRAARAVKKKLEAYGATDADFEQFAEEATLPGDDD